MQEKLKISLRNSLTSSTSLNPTDRRVTGAASPNILHSSQPPCNFQPLAYRFSTRKANKREPQIFYITSNKDGTTIYTLYFTDRKQIISLSLCKKSKLPLCYPLLVFRQRLQPQFPAQVFVCGLDTCLNLCVCL